MMLEKHTKVESVFWILNILSYVMTHNISNNIRYTFVRTSNKPYDVWACLHKDTGTIVEAYSL